MAKGYLSDKAKITILSTTTLGAAGSSAIVSTALDMTGYEGVLFIVPLGTIVSGAATSVSVGECATTGGSYNDILGTSQTIADTDDDKLVYVDVRRPLLPFLKLTVSRATQNATIGGIIAIQYDKRSLIAALTHGTGVSGEKFTSAAEGTA